MSQNVIEVAPMILETNQEKPRRRSLNFKSSPILGFAAVAVAGVSYGVQGVLAKYAYADGANPDTLLTIRFIIASLVIWATIGVFLRRRQPIPVRQTKKKMAGFFFLGLVWIGNSWFYFKGLETMPASTAALLVSVFPALVVLWSTMFFGEKLNWVKTGALGLALIGCFLTVDPAVAFAATTTFSWVGALLVMGSAFTNSWYSVLAGRLNQGTPGLVATAYMLPVTALSFIIITSISGTFNFGMGLTGWLLCIVLGSLTGLSVYLILVGIAIIGPSRAAITSTTEPGASVFLGFLLLGEPLNVAKLTGGFCILAAVLFLARQSGDKDKIE